MPVPRTYFTQTFLPAWLAWWRSLSLFRKVGPVALIALYWLILSALSGLRLDHINLGLVILLLYYLGAPFKRLFLFALPVLLTGIVYDSQRFYSDYLRGPVHVEFPYWFDKTFFGIPTPTGILTANEWWQLHLHPVLDLITGFAYLTFVFFFVFFAGWMTFRWNRSGTKKQTALEIARRAPGLMWGFFWLNLLGYSTYYWFAAAPPWYVAIYGLGPADLTAKASAAGCVRFDEILGTQFFSEMYGRSADVFGAVPSLHVAYPLLAFMYALRFGGLRLSTFAFYILMCFSAVYLNHHYILDILWGSVYAVIIFYVMERYYQRKPVPTMEQAKQGIKL